MFEKWVVEVTRLVAGRKVVSYFNPDKNPVWMQKLDAKSYPTEKRANAAINSYKAHRSATERVQEPIVGTNVFLM